MSRLLLLLLVVAVAAAHVIPRNVKFNPKSRMHRGRRYGGSVLRPPRVGPIAKAAVAAKFDQQIDHFGSAGTFQQRYWYSDQYYKLNGPIFLMIEGEGEASDAWIERTQYPFNYMAKDNGAYMFILEHRFYGSSQPFNDYTVPHLKYLSSRQALEDIAAFIKSMNSKFSLTGKWITFGGSYSGALSAWMREKYPDLVYAAVATSGPVLAEVNFVEYLETVQTALTEQDAKCGANVHSGFMKINELIKTSSGKNTLNDLFNPCNDLNSITALDTEQFFDSLLSGYMEIVQYGGDNAGDFRYDLTEAKACSFHLDDSVEPIQQIANFNSWFMEYYGEWCLYNDFQGEIDCLKDTSLYGQCADWRPWFWQTCTEFAYYYTAESKNQFFGNVTHLDYFEQECIGAFGKEYNLDEIKAAVDSTNQFYGGNTKYTGTRVIFPNGSWDPWHPLGVLASNFPDYTAVYMKGTAHCADMYGKASDDLPSLVTGRETIELQVATWCNQ